MDQIIGFFETYHPFRHLLFAILILVLGHWLMKLVTRWLERVMARAQVEPTVTRFITHVGSVILLTAVVIIASGNWGFRPPRCWRCSVRQGWRLAWRYKGRSPTLRQASCSSSS